MQKMEQDAVKNEIESMIGLMLIDKVDDKGSK